MRGSFEQKPQNRPFPSFLENEFDLHGNELAGGTQSHMNGFVGRLVQK